MEITGRDEASAPRAKPPEGSAAAWADACAQPAARSSSFKPVECQRDPFCTRGRRNPKVGPLRRDQLCEDTAEIGSFVMDATAHANKYWRTPQQAHVTESAYDEATLQCSTPHTRRAPAAALGRTGSCRGCTPRASVGEEDGSRSKPYENTTTELRQISRSLTNETTNNLSVAYRITYIYIYIYIHKYMCIYIYIYI